MKKFGLCGIGNAIVDLLVHVEDEELSKLNLKKAGMQLVDSNAQAELLKALTLGRQDLVAKSGGSVANSIIAFAQLGGAAAFLGCVGPDSFGESYRSEMQNLGIEFSVAPLREGVTASSVILVTPDAERTMNTSLGCAGEFGAEQVSEAVIKDSEWLLIEGYLLANPEKGVGAVRTAIEYAKKHGTKLALTCSDAWVVECFRDAVNELVPHLDLLVANEEEALAFSGCTEVEEAFHSIRAKVPLTAVTRGPKGVLVGDSSGFSSVDAFFCKPEDLTGAGDAFLGTFLYGLQVGQTRELAARRGCFVSSKVIAQLGPRLESPKEVLQELDSIATVAA